jgi:hypothetical protein
MFIWRNLSPKQIVDCIDYFFPGGLRASFDDGGPGDGVKPPSPRINPAGVSPDQGDEPREP